MSCGHPYCKTNDDSSFYYCPKCLKINFPRLNIEDLYELYAETIENIDWLVDIGEAKAFETLTPDELKDFAFDLYNKLILQKQKEGA